jgi:4-amino-4-deoxy-L-arabinose transferase-like glycosyltransferase
VRFLAIALLILSFGLMVNSAGQKSPTVDEPSHLFRGVAYLKTGATHFLWGHPLLASSLNALPLLTEAGLQLPVNEPAWAEGDWAIAGDAFLWRLNPNPQRLVFLGRLPTIWLTLLLGALIVRWGRQTAGPTAALFALALFALDPNILAHGQLITSDLPLAFFMTLTVYAYWRWSEYTNANSQIPNPKSQSPISNLPIQNPKSQIQNPKSPNPLIPAPSSFLSSPEFPRVPALGFARESSLLLLLAGAALGAAAATKFNAALLLPSLGLLALYLAIRRRQWQPILALLFIGLVAWFTIWLVYGLALRPLPGGAFWLDLQWQFDYLSRPHGAYLNGRYHPTGWYYYFPFAFLVKTPLPTLLLLAYTLILFPLSVFLPSARPNPAGLRRPAGFLWLPPLVYFVISLLSPLNIGYRHLIPMLPFLYLFIAYCVLRIAYFRFNTQYAIRNIPITHHVSRFTFHAPRFTLYALLFLLLLETLSTHPDYLPYFNQLAGRESWRLLSDSNIDWGQDLPALAVWQQQSGQRIKLSYFGMAHPSAYGLQFEPLPTWSPGPEQGNPMTQPFNPADPAPGFYAISITNLHGLVLGEQADTFAWFRDRPPLARIGGSIFIYDVQPTGLPIAVAFAGLRPAELNPALQASFPGNDVRPRWFNAATSLIWPAEGGWLALEGQTADPALASYWPTQPAAQQGNQSLYRLDGPPTIPWQPAQPPGGSEPPGGLNAGGLEFLGYLPVEAPPGEIALLTGWQVRQATGRPLKIFVHALNADDAIAGQWDGLDVDSLTWQPGDLIIQLHRFPISETAGPLHLTTGLYDAETLERLLGPLPIGN